MGNGCERINQSGSLFHIMRDTDIFELALGLSSPWKVKESIFDPESKRLDILLHFARGSTFTCPDCKQTE